MTYRLITTGCRDWTDRAAIGASLSRLETVRGPIVVVHGDCPTGADKMVEEWCLLRSFKTERHPALWQRPDGSTNKGAGFYRNIEMAKLGGDYCLAFWDGRSPGTGHMITQVVRRGISVRIIARALGELAAEGGPHD